MSKVKYDGPAKYKPIGGWGYVGLSILYAIPVLGWIFLIVHAICAKNVNTRKYARSYFCWLLLAIIAGVALGVIGVIFGEELLDQISGWIENSYTSLNELVDSLKDMVASLPTAG